MVRSKRATVQKLRTLGLYGELAEKTYNVWGGDADEYIRMDPYKLLREVEGVGWELAERIARDLKFTPDAPERMRGAVYAGLLEAANEGHTCVSRASLLTGAARLAATPDMESWDEGPDLNPWLDELIDGGSCVDETSQESETEGDFGDVVQLASLHRSEAEIALYLKNLLERESPFARKNVSAERLHDVERDLGLTLAENQRRALEQSVAEKILILTGGPGTGKTTILRGVIRLWENQGARIRLAAPTGRAAKKLSEATRRPASTIHRLLEYQPDARGFSRNARRRLRVDLLVVDETSMLDTELMAALLQALPERAHLLLVGDIDQLPSVGPGTVLEDLIASGHIQTIRLTEIFRQSEGSLIAVNAQRINAGEEPILESGGLETGQDFFAIERNTYSSVVETVLEMVTKRIPAQFDLKPLADIQVIVPMHKGQVGVENLNAELQPLVRGSAPSAPGGKPSKPLVYDNRSFEIGDKVMQTKNDYARDVFNGDLGIVTDVDPSRNRLVASIDGRAITYERQDLRHLVLAYAITIHKSQGSEYPAVVVPLVMGHRRMLQRNLLYTAISRGQRLVVLVGNRRAIQMAIQNDQVVRRRTRLQARLASMLSD